MAFPVLYHDVQLSMLNVFYREAGDRAKPAVPLLHGFPTSSHMFRNLIPALAPNAYVIAPDLPGFGITESSVDGSFQYTFDNLALVVQELITYLGLNKYVIYVMGYGAPTGFRLALKYPESILGFIVQNGIAYTEGFTPFWEPIIKYWKERTPEVANALIPLFTLDATKSLYTDGAHDVLKVSPDNWFNDYYFMQLPGHEKIHLDLLYDYQSNVDMYSKIHWLFCKYQFPTLIAWGKNDALLALLGAEAYLQDLPKAELHFFDGGHFVLEEYLEEISAHINRFVKAITST